VELQLACGVCSATQKNRAALNLFRASESGFLPVIFAEASYGASVPRGGENCRFSWVPATSPLVAPESKSIFVRAVPRIHVNDAECASPPPEFASVSRSGSS